VSAEKLYQQVKTGKVKLDDLNDEGKAALKSYMATKQEKQKETLVNTGKTLVSTAKKIGDKIGGDLKTAFSVAQERGKAVQAEKKAKEEAFQASKTPYEKWYDKNIADTKVGKVLGLAQKADRTVSNVKAGVLDTASIGATQGLGRAATSNIPEGETNLKPIFDERLKGTDYKVGQIAGYVAPGVIADRAVVKLGGQLLPKLPKVMQGLVRGGAVGALDTAAQEGGDVAFREGTFDPANVALGVGLGGGLGAAVPAVGKLIQKFRAKPSNVAPEVEQSVRNAFEGKAMSNLRNATQDQYVNRIMGQIKDDVYQRMTPPLENPNELAKWVKSHMGDDISLNEIRKLTYDDLGELANEIKSGIKMYDVANSVAKERGFNLDDIFAGKLPSVKETVARDASRRAYGVGEAPNINIQRTIRPEGPQIPRGETPLPRTTPVDNGTPLNSSPGRQPQPIKLDDEVRQFNESGAGNADTFGSKISNAPKDKKGSISKWWEKTRTQLVDDLAPLEGLEKRVSGSVASAEDSLYKSGRMFKGTPERAAQIVQDRLSPIVRNVEKSGNSATDLGKYALARHAKDVNDAGLQSGFTNAEIDDVLARYGTPEMEAARQELVQVNKDMLAELVDSGVVSKELASVLNDRWKNYIPLFRAFDDESVDIGAGLSNSLANVASPIKTLKGSRRAVIDPLENMVKNIAQSINAAERNRVASQLHRLHEIDTQSNFIRKLGEGEEVGRKNVVNVKHDGNNVKYEVEPEVYKALLNLDKESSNMITNILSKPASLLRAGATLTPEFSLRNPMRDVVQAFVVSKSGFNPITDFGAGLIQSIKKGPLYKEWIDNLGAYGNVMSMDRNVHRQALEKVFKEPLSKKFVNIVTGKSLVRALRYITDTTESATKIGEYRAALRKGVTKQEAAYRSRDIMDFARAGSGVRQANKMVAFLNANIQGKSKLIRAIKENPSGTIARAATAVTIPTVGIYVLNKQFANDTQRETIDNAPDWMRNSFWLMAIPGTDVVARIPKPFDLAAIFSNLPERALDFTFENDREAFDGFISRTLKESALPMQISGLMPFIEGMANYSFFREGDIIPQREQGLKYSDQYDPVRTTEAGKFIASGVEKITGGKGAFKNFSSPRVIDNTIQGLTAGLGKYGTDAIDSILTGIRIPFTNKKITPAIVDRPSAPAKSLEQKPFAKAFLVDPNQGGKDMDKFYSEIDKLSEEKASSKLNEENFGYSKNYLLKELNSASDDVSDINKEIRAIEKDRLLTPQQKKMKIDRLITDRKKLVKDAVGLIK
jgi:RNase H-fold protein (predicted Holliday junction resolvase)